MLVLNIEAPARLACYRVDVGLNKGDRRRRMREETPLTNSKTSALADAVEQRLHIVAPAPEVTDDTPAERFKWRTWMKYERAQQVVGASRILRRLTIGIAARLQLLILSGHKDHETLARIKRCRRGAESLLTGNEAFLLYSIARAQSRLEGAMAELGVFQGSSARIICEAKEERPLYLFDTFTGLPEPGANETLALRRGQFAASLPAVRTLLKPYGSVHFHTGFFPRSTTGLDGVRFSLVHLDADLYSSTLAGLAFFYPRMVPGGIIIAHDYSTLPGVAQAFQEFLVDRPETIIELPTTQVMLIAAGPRRLRSATSISGARWGV
jgi:O-methyltransferase